MVPQTFRWFDCVQEVRHVVRVKTRFLRPYAALAFVLVVGALPRSASAQMNPGGPPGGQVGGDEEQKPEGAAEKAPSEAGQLPSTPYLPPYPGEKKKAFELIELDGYYRLRTDWQSNYHLGFKDLGSGTPYPEPFECHNANGTANPCGKTIGSANMRLRLEPTINLSEKVSVHTQIDVLDNLVLGSTNDGTYADGTQVPGGLPIDFLSDNQESPQAGKSSTKDSIRVKRVWGDVETPVGRLKFGRMPDHWGLGINSNGGGEDPFHEGEYCLDCDSGDTVDRVIFNAKIPGTPFTGALGIDWAAGGPSNFRLFPERYDGKDSDLTDSDDAKQYVFVISDLRTADAWKESLDAGKAAFDWGVKLTYRQQDREIRDSANPSPSVPAVGTIQNRNAYMYIPDAYFRFGVGKLNLEGEAVAVLGDVNHTTDLDTTAESTTPSNRGDNKLLQFGAVARLNYLMADDDFNLGIEVGSASGDQWESAKQGQTYYTQVPALSPDKKDENATGFVFDPNYHVDLILFRELLGAVRNATYVKPNMYYNLTSRIRFKAAAIMSFANVLVSTPGNGSLWGVELDGDLGYHNDKEGFFGGISYGVLFPLSAMDHPDSLYANVMERGTAATAQTIQMRLVLKF
jgi:uncharacterized protein (TIGR04551 family)